MGWATAHHLLRIDPDLEVVVVEKDPTLRYSSTMLSDGNVRIQFNLPENIAMSQYAMECLENWELEIAVDGPVSDPGVRKQGNLFLVDEDGKADALAGLAAQRELGCDTAWLDMEEVEAHFPALSSQDFVGGTLGPNDGSVDPTAVVDGYRRSATDGGAGLETATVESLVVSGQRITGVHLRDGTTMGGDAVVVCAGAWTAQLLTTVGVEIPVEPVMRTVFVVAADLEGGDRIPSVFLPSGVYVIREHPGTFLMGWSTDDDPVGYDFTPAPRSKFYDQIWPELASHLPAFDRLEVVRSWAGLYAQNRMDANAIIGEWPGIEAMYVATGFSGHGFQQCFGVGRHLAELICDRTPSLDLARLGPQRIIDGNPLMEHAGRII